MQKMTSGECLNQELWAAGAPGMAPISLVVVYTLLAGSLPHGVYMTPSRLLFRRGPRLTVGNDRLVE